MKDNKRIRRTQVLRSGSTLLLFVVFNVLMRLLLVPINEAEYTDGILQLTQFANQTGIYPPLYTILTWPLAQFIPPMWAGRLVSALFSGLSVIPIYLLTKRCYGSRAAFFAALIFTFAPTSLRWAPRVMTESVFCFFFWFSCERLMTARATRDSNEMESAIVWASVLGALAALTRYQGVFLALPALILCFYLYRRNGVVPWKGLSGLLLYGLIPLWSAVTNTIHGGQLAERMGDVPFMTFLLNAEPFVLYFPYFLTYPVAILVMMGMIKGRARPRAGLMPLTLYVFAILLVLQSLFGSFQERYFLPLFGLFFVWAGLGMAAADHSLRRHAPRFVPYLPILVITWSAAVSFFVLAGSRQVFGDLRQASEFAAAKVNAEGGRLYTNEIYRAERPASGKAITIVPGLITANLGVSASDPIVANKVMFFTEGNVFYLGEEYYMNDLPLKRDDILVMSDLYGRDMQMPVLNELYFIEPLAEFQSVVIPVFPDIMQVPGTNQNPAAFLYRYMPQHFSTTVYRVVGRR